jgi:hypothetical protein
MTNANKFEAIPGNDQTLDKSLSLKRFKHETVNHSENFVDPSTGACTNLIENRWWCIKRQPPTTHTRAKTFDKHLMEYMWRTLYSQKWYILAMLLIQVKLAI